MDFKKGFIYNENILNKIIIQNYFPNKIYNFLINELKTTSISERVKTKLVNLIFSIALFNKRDQIIIEDVFEGMSLTLKNNIHY